MKINFVCTGNICRSPMAAVMCRDALEQAGLSERVTVVSSGIGSWHVGEPADERTLAELNKIGLDGSDHRAQQIDIGNSTAHYYIALDRGHRDSLRELAIPDNDIYLLRSFDPNASADADVADPFYGRTEDFVTVREEITAALPGLVEFLRGQLESEQ